MKFYDQSPAQTEKELKTSIQNGLSSEEVKARLAKYGPNKLREKKQKTMFARFMDQFKDPMILILVAAAVISLSVSLLNHEGIKGLFEPFLILLIVVVNAIMGVMQEDKAQKALDALRKMSAPQAKVIRDGKETLVESSELVPGDLIRLEAGDYVPADARLITSSALKSEESALTGESVPSTKEADAIIEEGAPLGDRKTMVYSGCSISYGTGTALVTATGMDTEMGRIANLLDNENETMTPLQKKLNTLGKYLGILAIVCCAIIFVVGLMDGQPPLELFMTSVSLAVSAIPEGLPAIVTIVLSIGVQRMVKKNAIIRKLPAVETLGSTSVICSDKTGTLTQNRMTVVEGYVDGSNVVEKVTSDSSKGLRELLKYGTLDSDGTISWENGKAIQIGDPTETSIVMAADENGMKQEDLNKEYPRVVELPFDSDRKMMTSINKMDGKYVAITKGAVDEMLDKITHGDKEKAREINQKMSENALRVIAIAKREFDELPSDLSAENIEKDLTFLGMVGMIDPARPEARDAVAEARKAGIRTVMITGDHVVTASAIARELGILEPGEKAVTGRQIDAMSDRELDQNVNDIAVYARVSPENKIRIVKSWQRQGKVVAMTGDGVNDAPALKSADIGVAMGITGTDVAKGAADMTLTDDNFATILAAVKEGRGIYNNIKNVVGYLLGTNIGEVICVFLVMLISKQSIFLSMQLLWINMVTDSLPAIALGMEAVPDSVMLAKPKPRNEGIFARGFGLRIILQGLMFGALAIIAFYIGENTMHVENAGRTLAFMVLACSQTVQAYNMRSEQSLFKIGVFSNKHLNYAALFSLVMMALVLFVPGVMSAFSTIYLTGELYLIGIGLIFVPVVVMECSKAFGLIRHEH
ncbi:calcium-translocating P-type ATPase, PMCA-type [Allobaculum fili]|uniref:calcium-translocating P-type ATPase, PMCA-type n=3 Tax=Allobaculum TaxID=174708 RepID=UPI001E62A1E4|nr:calcium-translocating P-type ATPase, PMCA-type [Allobaculum fili]